MDDYGNIPILRIHAFSTHMSIMKVAILDIIAINEEGLPVIWAFEKPQPSLILLLIKDILFKTFSKFHIL